MKQILIFPHQLFKQTAALTKADKVILIEESLFFYDPEFPVKFHKQKLVLHRASLKSYQQYLESHNIAVDYLDYHPQVLLNFFKNLKPHSEIHFYDPVDYLLTKRLKQFATQFNHKIIPHESPNFICTNQELKDFFKTKKRFHQTDFYKWQRQRYNILMTGDQKPVGDKLTFDTENRKKLPAKIELPKIPEPSTNPFVLEAKDYVQTNFSDHPGQLDHFNYPIDHQEAESCLQNFFKSKFTDFGIYEDAITKKENPYLFHSALSAPLNIGLLDPLAIIKQAEQQEVPLNSKEGFIRQILGWREFMRAIYILKGTTQRNSNFFKHTKKLPETFWTGQTSIEPIDDIIKKLHKYAYSHHIERLMVVGNFMNLAEIDPNQVYEWFMTFYIDAYDWVMVPNVYGMTLFADGGLITTKPYISSSNYIHKMSDYKKADWSELWDALYWNFVDKHQDFLKKNIRFSMILRQYEKMDLSKKKKLNTISQNYFKSLQ
jgi:deoxyribodipyrimidine photolyase-related protein